MSDSEEEIDAAFGAAIGRIGPPLLSGLVELEAAFRALDPSRFGTLRERLRPLRDALARELEAFGQSQTPPSLEEFRADLSESARLAREALSKLVEPGAPGEAAPRALQAMHLHARAQARLYPLRTVLSPVSAFFAETFRHDELERLEPTSGAKAEVGLFRSGETGERGGFDLYVPECYDGREPWPLIVALHGGSGNGADFLWIWLREARSRRCLLLAPTSRGSTWSLQAPEIDGHSLRGATEWVASRWRVDRNRVLLTGLSDGATMSLLVGLGVEAPFSHLAPIAGVLHPLNFTSGNLDRAQGRPIRLVHGALDWMFPIALAREAARVLEDAGAELAYHEIADLSHTYPREENARLIEWLDPGRSASALRPDACHSASSSDATLDCDRS